MWQTHLSAPVVPGQNPYRSDFSLAPTLWVQIKPGTADSILGHSPPALGVLSGYSWSSLGIGSPLRPASRLLAANRDMVFRVPWVALPMWGRITAKKREREVRGLGQEP